MSALAQPSTDVSPEAVLAAARTSPPRDILIAGAGIGGLATAIALARAGFSCHVLERRPAFAEEGAGIQIGPNGTRLLARLGVADALASLVGAPDAIRVRDARSGASLVRLPLGSWIAARHGAPYWTIHRHDLHAALAARALADPAIKISMGAEVLGAASDATAAAVTTMDGRSFLGAALVAADGVDSSLRLTHFDPRPLRPAGKSALRCVIPAERLPPEIAANETGLWLDSGAHVVHYPVRGGSEIALVAVFDDPVLTEAWATPVEPAVVRARAAPFAPELVALLGVPHTWRKWSLRTHPGPRRWVKGRIALLGDAAHPILPFLAQGGVMALEDAAVLAQCLLRRAGRAGGSLAEDVPAALADYERQRRRRARAVVAASRLNGRLYHLSGSLAAARNAAMRAAGGARLMMRFDWVYGWVG